MDKDHVVLHGISHEVEDADSDLAKLKQSGVERAKKMEGFDARLSECCALLGKQKTAFVPAFETPQGYDGIDEDSIPFRSYEEIYEMSREDLLRRGLDVNSLDYHSLLSAQELDTINTELNRVLPRREKWGKRDFIAVFIAASVGSLVDFILSDRNNPLTGTHSDLSKWLNNFHQHQGGAPIDYQGLNFGGGFHRELSKGHDILRFISAIKMFKEGRFEGVQYVDGIRKKVVRTVNQNGTPYEQLTCIEAIIKYAKHMFADLFSTYSLPFPGYSFLAECSDRDVRKLAATMYQNGFNIKNVMMQSLSAIIVEVILRIYFSIEAVERYRTTLEIAEDYSNWEAIKTFVKPGNKDKLNEMLLLSHSIVAAMNIGKVVIQKAPWEINIAEMVGVIRYAVSAAGDLLYRNSEYAKLLRNGGELHDHWEMLYHDVVEEKPLFESMPPLLI